MVAFSLLGVKGKYGKYGKSASARQWHLVQQTRDQALTAGNRTLVETVTNWKD